MFPANAVSQSRFANAEKAERYLRECEGLETYLEGTGFLVRAEGRPFRQTKAPPLCSSRKGSGRDKLTVCRVAAVNRQPRSSP